VHHILVVRPINVRPAPFVPDATCFLADDVLDAGACAGIVAHVTGATQGGFATTDIDYPPSYRDNDRAVLTDEKLAAALFERMRHVLPGELEGEDGARLRLVGLNERFRMCRYHDGQCFRIHQDGAHRAAGGVRSRLTLQIYLDEGFEGGATRFYSARRGAMLGAIVPRTGTAIVFDHRLWHDGEPVVRGTKHVLRTDVLYAPADPSVATAGAGHVGYVFCATALSDGMLATGSRDRTIALWRTTAEGFVHDRSLTGHDASVLAIAELSPDHLVSGSRDRTVRLFDRTSGTSRILAALGGAVLSIVVLDDETIACGSADGRITLLDHEGRRIRELIGHTGWVWSLARLGGGDLASGSEDGTIRVWTPKAGACRALADGKRGPVHALSALESGAFAAGFANGQVVVYDGARLSERSVLYAHEGEVYALAKLEGNRLASGGEDARARVFSLDTGAELASLETNGFVRAIASVDDSRMAVGSYDGSVRMWLIRNPVIAHPLGRSTPGSEASDYQRAEGQKPRNRMD
jgi:hypothetical protein